MIRALSFFLLIVASPSYSQMVGNGAPTPDPFALNERLYPEGTPSVSGLTPRTQAFNSANKNLALIVVGQSLCGSQSPTAFVPGSSAIDQFSVYDGGSYNFISGPMVGPTYDGLGITGGGPGNVGARLAQLFITNAIFDHVVVASVCVGSTTAALWASNATNDVIWRRLPVVIKRLISRGFTPGANGWTFAISWWQGEQDNSGGTSSASYQASMATILANAQAAGFVGRFFVNTETWVAGATSATIQAAQAATISNDPTHFFAGGNIDSLNATNRLADNTHLNDTGSAASALLVYNAMHASGSPF